MKKEFNFKHMKEEDIQTRNERIGKLMKKEFKHSDEDDLKGRIANLELIVFRLQKQIDILIKIAEEDLI